MSNNLVIVAIPAANDRVWKISSEKKPHMTLCFLGDAESNPNVQGIMEFVQHAVNVSEHGDFMLRQDYRDVLGEDKADVIHFEKDWSYKWINHFRSMLLQNGSIRAAYESVEQFPEWRPHLTLGYPETPAKELENEYDLDWVTFDRIAVWIGNYEGPEFRLKWPEREGEMAVAGWSGVAKEGEQHILEHYGVKGMRWGVRQEHARGGYKGETKKGWLDPEGQDLTTDAIKAVLWPMLPPLGVFALPAQVRLLRAGGRALDSKILDVQEKKFVKDAQSEKNFVEIHNRSTEKFNREIKTINDKYPGDVLAPAKQKKYDAEVQTLMQDSYRQAAKTMSNRGRSMHLDLEFKPNGTDFVIKAKHGRPESINRLKHADETDALEDAVIEFDITGKILRNKTGHILGFAFDNFKPKPRTMEHTVDLGAEFLEHYGVKGMRWGVKRQDVETVGRAVGKAANASGRFVSDVHFETQTNRQKDEEGRDIGSKADALVTRGAQKDFHSVDLPKINAKPEYVKARKLTNRMLKPFDRTTRAYRKEVRESYIQRLEKTANSMKNASGSREYTIRERGGDLPTSKYYWEVSSRAARHAAEDDFVLVEVLTDDDGFITGTRNVKDENTSIAQMAELGVEFLEHYGVKGMQWGVRKAPPAPVAAQARSVVPHGSKRKTKIKVEGGENHEASEDAIKVAQAAAKLKKSGTKALSNKELQDVATRMNLERNVKQLVGSQTKIGKGRRFVKGLTGFNKELNDALNTGLTSARLKEQLA